MTQFNPVDHPHRRYNPRFRRAMDSASPHRAKLALGQGAQGNASRRCYLRTIQIASLRAGNVRVMAIKTPITLDLRFH
ncbi:hypothetical protein [Escherichia coli]|uniref:hypothetical protein n=1 Tax=Escherichia coli TaxID=562 RepID=UPI003890C9C3